MVYMQNITYFINLFIVQLHCLCTSISGCPCLPSRPKVKSRYYPFRKEINIYLQINLLINCEFIVLTDVVCFITFKSMPSHHLTGRHGENFTCLRAMESYVLHK